MPRYLIEFTRKLRKLPDPFCEKLRSPVALDCCSYGKARLSRQPANGTVHSLHRTEFPICLIRATRLSLLVHLISGSESYLEPRMSASRTGPSPKLSSLVIRIDTLTEELLRKSSSVPVLNQNDDLLKSNKLRFTRDVKIK